MSTFYTILTGIGFLLIPFGLFQISNKKSHEYYKKYKKGIYLSGIGFILFFLGLIKATQPDFPVGFILILFSSLTAIYFNPYFFSKRMKQKKEELSLKSLTENLNEEEQRSHDYFNSEQHWYDLSKKTIKIGLLFLIIEFIWNHI